jgi:hypothetical protein
MHWNIPTKLVFAAVTSLGLGVLGAGCVASAEPPADGEEEGESGSSAVGAAVCQGSEPGAYCGNDSMSQASAGTLYQCPGKNKAPTSAKACQYGCIVAPPGQPDRCASAPVCKGPTAGSYCGNDMVQGGSAGTLYECPGPGKAPLSSQTCDSGCVVAPQGQNDHCKAGGGGGQSPDSYRLPWHAGTSMQLTQDCNDSCCADHVGTDEYAWDFANGGSFEVRAARAGTVTHLKTNSTSGCGSKACVNEANYIVIDHGDGTQSTYLHLAGGTLDPAVTCGGHVDQGQRLARAGSTGWSSGTHLHFQVSKVHGSAPTCECGSAGQACNAGTVAWGNFWVDASHPSVPVSFEEWPSASQCGSRRIQMPASTN